MCADVLIIPDVHAGYSYSRVDELGQFLSHKLADGSISHLVFLGDVLELWRDSQAAAIAAATPLFAPVQQFAANGGTISYLAGNHDYPLVKDASLRKTMSANLGGTVKGAVKFYHRYQLLNVGTKKILLAHGDDYDFLYPALVWADPVVPIDLTADDVYYFYEWCCANYQTIKTYEKEGLRAAFVAWLREYVSNLGARGATASGVPSAARTRGAGTRGAGTRGAGARGAAPSGTISTARRRRAALAVSPQVVQNAIIPPPHVVSALAAAPPAGGGAASSLAVNAFLDLSLGGILARMVSVELDDIVVRTPVAQRWSEVDNNAPFTTKVGIADFQTYNHIIVGHFHMPRQSSQHPVTDAGSWVHDPKGQLESATYAIVQSDQVQLRQWKNGSEVFLSARGL